MSVASTASFAKMLRSFACTVESGTCVLSGVIDASWGQGRTCFGGIGAAVALSATQRVVQSGLSGDDIAPALRSVNTTFVGPIAPGSPVEVRATLLRQGKSVTAVEAKVFQGGDLCTSINAVFGASRATTANIEAPRTLRDPTTLIPDRESLKSIPSLRDKAGNLMEPLFLEHFEVRSEMGLPLPRPNPFQGRRFSGWIRLRDEEAQAFATSRLLAICDMPPPLIMLHYKVPTLGSSLTWSLEFVQNPERVTTEWFYLDYHLDSASDGYSQQSGTIYDEAGAVVALSRQCMVYFEPKPAPAS